MQSDTYHQSTSNNSEGSVFHELWNGASVIKLPQNWTCCKYESHTERKIIVTEIYFIDEIICNKNIIIYPDGKYCIFLDSHLLMNPNLRVIDNIKSVEDLQMLIVNLTKIKRCHGSVQYEKYPNTKVKCIKKDEIFKKYRHYDCELVTLNENSCMVCRKVSNALRVESHRNKLLSEKKTHSSTLSNIKVRHERKRQKIYKLQIKLKKTREKLMTLQEKYNKLSENAIQEALDKCNLGGTMKAMIEECFKLGKHQDCHGRRYSGDWLLTCLLINIRSPSTYKFLRVNNILPLPSPTTIRRYLAMIKMKCGLDDNFFKAMRIKMSKKKDLQKHGILIFDEIQVRSSLEVNVKKMNYDGIVDFGSDCEMEQKNGGLLLADHALVYMFSSLGENFHQPVAVYGVKGATKGTTLAKLTLEVIRKLESCGCYVDGIISDGATTNRRMWKEFGVCGELGKVNNKIVHPCQHSLKHETRYLYFFSDWIHLIKCIRSRFQQKIILKVGNVNFKGRIESIYFCFITTVVLILHIS